MIEQDLKHAREPRGLSTGPRWGCPDEVVLAAFADGQLDDTGQVESHLADCAHCREQVTFLVGQPDAQSDASVPAGLLARAEAFGAKGSSRAVSPAWRWATAAAVTACLVLVMSHRLQERELGVVFAPPLVPQVDSASPAAPEGAPSADTATPKDKRRVRGADGSLPTPDLIQPVEGAKISGELRFRWLAVGGSLSYEVRVATAAGDPVWQSERVSGTEVRPPPSVHLVSGEKYFVWVVAYLPEGKTLRSKAVAFAVQN